MGDFLGLMKIKLRNTREWTEEEIKLLMSLITDEVLNDFQIGGLVTAMYTRGLSMEELTHLTREMIRTSYTFTWPDHIKPFCVDKHSTGGVGDKVSLVLVPVLVAQGLKVPMVSGRSLGWTGGTLDKLESIPGFDVYQSPENIKRIVETVGGCIVGQTAQIVPTDKVMYHARNQTGTVDNIELVTSSILSKKAIEGISSLLLDVKYGHGLVQDYESGEKLVNIMISLGHSLGMNITCLLTDMYSPVGAAVGHALEVFESIMLLRGSGASDLKELVVTQACHLMVQSGVVTDLEVAKSRVIACLEDHSALQIFKNIIVAQGVNEKQAQELVFGNPWKVLKKSPCMTSVKSPRSGYVKMINAYGISELVHKLSDWKTTGLDHSVGIVLQKTIGDRLVIGEAWMEIHHRSSLDPELLAKAEACLQVSPSPVTPTSKISKIIRSPPA